MKRLTATFAAIAFVAVAPALSAQRITADLRGAIASPTGKLGGTELNTGPALGATLALRLQPHLHLYGGWDWARFGTDESFAGVKRDFEETGYTFGLRFEHPFSEASRMAYRLEAGGTYKHIEIENDDGDLIADSDHGLGFELGGGVLLPLYGSLKLAPMLRYRSLSRDFTIGSVTTSGDLRYVALEIGISRRF